MAGLPQNSIIVSLHGVAKSYANGVRALENFDLDIRLGEFVSLLGPSGCGKSTALRIIAGLSEATSGEVAWPQGKAPLGFVFQEPTLMPWATVAKNVALPLQLTGMQAPNAVAEN